LSREKEKNSSAAVWLTIGGGAMLVVVVYVMTRPKPAPSAPKLTIKIKPGGAITHVTQGAPLATHNAKFSMTAKDGVSIALKVGDTLALMPPHPAGPNQSWKIEVLPAGGGGLIRDAAIRVSPFPDGSFLLQADGFGRSTIVMGLNSTDPQHFGRMESLSMPMTVSA
jgi:hypothetical protein